MQEESVDLSPVTNALDSVRRAVLSNQPSKEVEVVNFDVLRLGIHKELKAVVDVIKSIEIPEPSKEIKVSNFPKQEKTEEVRINNLSELGTLLTRLISSVESISVNPVVNVPAPIVNIPEQLAPVVNIPPYLPQLPTDLSGVLAALKPLGLLSRDPNRPITVRMSDGRSFIDAIANTLKENGERLATVVSTSYGLTKDEFKSAQGELGKASNAVNDSVTVGAVSTAVVAARSNRISIVISNNSDETIYLTKGATAVINKGIRLNSAGGSIVIDDWPGAISAICASGNKTLCYSETY